MTGLSSQMGSLASEGIPYKLIVVASKENVFSLLLVAKFRQKGPSNVNQSRFWKTRPKFARSPPPKKNCLPTVPMTKPKRSKLPTTTL